MSLHRWRRWDDAPYAVCIDCDEMRDALTGHVVRPGDDTHMTNQSTPRVAEPRDTSETLTDAEREALTDWWHSDWPDTEGGVLDTLHGVVAGIVAGRSKALEARLAEERAAALREAAEDIRENAARAWGGDFKWLTTGTKAANVAADWLTESAAEIGPRA